MNRAAARIMARDPRISASGLRFLLMANISAREFCSGFRMRTCGECLALSTPSAQRLPVARKSKIHGGRGDFFSTRYGRIMLTYRTDRFSYVEDLVYDGPRRGATDVRLTLWNENLPNTVVAALPDRCLADLIGYGGIFLAAKATRIVRAEVIVYPGSTALRLDLGVPWFSASHALAMMG